MPPTPADAPPRRGPSVRLIIVVLTVAAVAVRLYRLRFGNAHAVVDYDSGVYFGSSLELVTGTLPYRDYVFVHPPVITLLFAPDALLAKVIGTAQAMGIAKIATGLAGAASVPLLATLVRSKERIVVAIACGIGAFQGDAVASSYTLLLEPWLVLFCLVGAVLAFAGRRGEVVGSRRIAWSGVAFGLACATKIWAVAPLLAVALVLLPHRRRAVTFLTGAVLGFAVPVLPFFAAAPGAFVHQVFTVQVFRMSSTERTPLSQRLIHMFGVAEPNGQMPSGATGLLLSGAVLVIVLMTVGWLRWRRDLSPFERFAGLSALLCGALLLAPDTFYWHYAAFSTPFLALAAAVLLPRLRGLAHRCGVIVLATCVAGLAFTMLHRDLRSYHLTDDHRAVDAVVPAGSCVVSTMVSATIAQDRFYADDPGCPVLVDSFGTVLGLADGRSPSAAALRNREIRALWLRIYQRADFVYVEHRDSPTVPSDPTLRRYLREHFRLVPIASAGRLYARR